MSHLVSERRAWNGRAAALSSSHGSAPSMVAATSSSSMATTVSSSRHSIQDPEDGRACFSEKTSETHQDSRGAITFIHQSQLPRLPVPLLEATLEKFLVFTEALLDEKQQRDAARDAALDFLRGDGPALQEQLLAYEKSGRETGLRGSYVEEFWSESYLAPDDSLVLNTNPYFLLEDPDDPPPESALASSSWEDPQLRRAAGLCYGAVQFASRVRRETLEPDTVKGQPLCMDQYRILLGSSRHPAFAGSSDRVVVDPKSSHVVVLSHNMFYSFPALWPDTGDVAVDESEVMEILRAIQRVSSQTGGPAGLGALTTLPRSKWAAARAKLCEVSERNRESLRMIDSALFVLVLDDWSPKSVDEAAGNMLGGTSHRDRIDCNNAGTCLNRWYDKLQVIVCKDGTAGCNFEHSAVDGHTVLRLLSDIFVDRSCSILSSGSNAPREEPAGRIIKRRGERSLDALPEHLDFDLPQEIVDSIRSAEVVLSDRLSTFDTVILEFKGFGKCLVTSRKMSPDAAVQMAMIIAHHRLCGRVACVYESVLTKSYYHGRTEAMRSATPSAKRLCEMWVGATSTEAEIMSALRDAATQHSRLVAECAKGYGVDRHLFSLKRIAELTGFKTPAFFESEAWRALNHTTLSTSNCGSHALRLVGFGPAVSDGFGIGYTIKENAISFSVSSKSGQSQRYVLALSNTLAEMEALLRKQDKC